VARDRAGDPSLPGPSHRSAGADDAGPDAAMPPNRPQRNGMTGYARIEAAVQDLERWIERCKAAEQALAARDVRLNELSRLAGELEGQRAHWAQCCAASESAFVEQRRLLGEAERENLETRRLLSERDAEIALLAHELADVRSSASWRWTQRALQSPPVQLFFGALIRSVARRRHPDPPQVSAAPSVLQPVPSPVVPEPPAPDLAPPDRAISALEARASRMISERGFLGVPRETFSQAGREQLIALLQEGLRPESAVLEFGCGCLRIAYWLIRFLDAGRFCGIEPAHRRVEYGLSYLFTPEEIRLKQPRFDFNPVFDSSVFHTKFDFYLARSIWTHASKPQIEAMLESFLHDAAPAATFLASYFPAGSPEEDYCGSGWVGTSHESSVPGVIRHALEWIVDQCGRRGLSCEELPGIDCDSQLWLRIRRESSHTDASAF
jgi:hypothetical protein